MIEAKQSFVSLSKLSSIYALNSNMEVDTHEYVEMWKFNKPIAYILLIKPLSSTNEA